MRSARMHEHTNGRAPGVAFVAADAPFGRAAIAVEFAFVGREATIGDLRPMDLQPMIDSMKSLNVAPRSSSAAALYPVAESRSQHWPGLRFAF